MEISFDRDLTETLASFNTPYFANANNAETKSCNSRTHSASRTVLNHDRAYVKPMMSKASVEAVVGYSEQKGHHYECKATFEFGEKNSSQNSKGQSEPNESREVNSRDRD